MDASPKDIDDQLVRYKSFLQNNKDNIVNELCIINFKKLHEQFEDLKKKDNFPVASNDIMVLSIANNYAQVKGLKFNINSNARIVPSPSTNGSDPVK